MWSFKLVLKVESSCRKGRVYISVCSWTKPIWNQVNTGLTYFVSHKATQQRHVDSGVSPWVRLHAVSTLGSQTGCHQNTLCAICREKLVSGHLQLQIKLIKASTHWLLPLEVDSQLQEPHPMKASSGYLHSLILLHWLKERNPGQGRSIV